MRFGSALIAAAVTTLGVLAVPASAQATSGATFYAASGAHGDCQTASTPCTLVDAFADAENAGPSNFVSVASGIYSPGEALVVSTPVTVEAASGATALISGDGSDPIFDASASLTLTGLTLDGGQNAVIVEPSGALTFANSVASNSSDAGLQIYGSATITDSTIEDNDQEGLAVSGTATVSDSTISGNGSFGINLQSVNSSTPSATVTESTVYDNGADGLLAGDGATANIYASSVLVNTGHELYTSGTGTIKAGGDLLAETQADGTNCGGDTATPLVTDAGYNISDDSSCSLSGTSVGSSTTLDGSIGAFDHYGGPAATVTISQGSPAASVVTGTPSGTTAICGTPDERGLTRPSAPCAAGAFDPNAATVHSTTTLQVTPNPATDTMTISATITGSVGAASGGTVDFRASQDGGTATDVTGCTAIPVSVGTATCQAASVTPLHGYQFVGVFSGSQTYSQSTSALTASVRALEATTTTVSVDSATHVTATVSLLNPNDPKNPPTGTVNFTIGAASAVGATLAATGSAVASAGLNVTTPLSSPTTISAAYLGNNNFAASNASIATKKPTLVAHLTSSKPKSKYGWYHTVVVVNWTCAPGTGSLLSCPKPTTLSLSKAKEKTTKTIHNSIGGTATTTSPAVNIDRIKPTIKITGVIRGHTYRKRAKVHPRCTAKDSVSGLAGRCKIKITHKKDGKRTSYQATMTATDKAGNRTVKTIGWKKKR